MRLLIILFFMAPAVLAQTPSRDSLDASSAWHTAHVDSSRINYETMTAYQDTTWYAHEGNVTPAIQLQLNVYSSAGRSDTVVVSKLERVFWNLATANWDSLWVPVPVLRLSDAAVDTICIVSRGPIPSQGGESYAFDSFLLYDILADGRPWRIERHSGAGHPVRPDASATHRLLFTFDRRKSYFGGAQ